MNKEDIINFLLWQKMCAKENVLNLFKEFVNEKFQNDKKDILEIWEQIEDLLDQMNKKLI
jgi:hypothetical protein